MDVSGTQSDSDQELRELRARAYGPDPDIQDDPAALARLAELEAARAQRAVPKTQETAVADDGPVDSPMAAPPVAPPQRADPATPEGVGARSWWPRLTSSRNGRVVLAICGAVTALGLVYAVQWLLGPHPEQTLWQTADEADAQVLGLLGQNADEVDLSTLEAYGSFRGVEPWSAIDEHGNPCLFIIERSSNTYLEGQCTPREAELVADVETWPAVSYDFADGLPFGSVIRFAFRGNTVDVFLHPAPEADPTS